MSPQSGLLTGVGTGPTRRGVWLLIALTLPPAVLAVGDLRFALLALVVNALWAGAVLLEAATLPRASSLSAARSFASAPRSGEEATLRLVLDPPASGGFRWRLTQGWPEGWTPGSADRGPEALEGVTVRGSNEGLTSEVQRVQPVGDGATLVEPFVVTPGRRGPTPLPPTRVEVRRGFPGLAARRFELAVPAEVDVQLDASGVGAWDRLRRSRSTGGAGVHRQRRIGDGSEFDQLRDYLPGDDHRDVDWKATARHGRPITTTRRAERRRDVVLAIDCGRMMGLGTGAPGRADAGLLGSSGGAGTRLDAAVQTALLLAHVAREQGDRVGLATFADRVHTWAPPAAGPAARHRLAADLAAAEARPAYSDFAALVATLRRRRSHRSLVLLFTDLEDPQLAADLASALPPLARRHAVVVISLRDAALDDLADGRVGSSGAAVALAARRLVRERDAHLADLRRRGVTVVHPEPGRLAVAAIDAYLAGKQRAFG